MRDRQATQSPPLWAVGLRLRARGGGHSIAALVTLVLLMALLVPGSMPTSPRSTSRLTAPADPANWNAGLHYRPNPRGFAVGVTHTQYSIDPWGDAQAQATAGAVLKATATYQNQH